MKIPQRTSLSLVLLLVSSVLLALDASPASAAGTTYWVDGASAQCTDTGAGLEGAPFCTITAATKKAVVPGDTVRIRPAVYREQVTLAGSGTAADPINILGEGAGVVVLGTRALGAPGLWTATGTTAWSTPYTPPSNPRQVLLDGERLAQASSASTTTAGSWFYDTTARVLYVDIGGANPGDGHAVEAGAQSYGVHVSSRHDVVVRGLTTRHQNFAGVRILSSSSVTVDGVNAIGSAANGMLVEASTAGGVLVRDAEVSGSMSVGIRLSGSSGVTVQGSRSHDNRLHGIGLSSSSNNRISGNRTYGNSSQRVDVTAAGIDVNASSQDNVVENNVAYENQDTGIQVYNGSHRALVVRNVSYDNGDHGFDTLASTQVRLVNNTAHGNWRDGISVEGGSTGATLANNALVDNGSGTARFDLYVDASSAAGFSSDHSIAYKSSMAPVVMFNGTRYAKLHQFAAATGNDAHGLALDPDFVDPAAGDFRLTPGSAAVDSADASASGFTSTDPAGNPLADDSLVPDTGSGAPSYADRGAVEMQPTAGAGNYAPHAALFLDPPAVHRPPTTAVTADATGSSDADQSGITSYTFDFGDGTVVGPQGEATATHVYDGTGTFTVTVTVTDGAGLTDVATAQETVSDRTLQTYRVAGSDPTCSDAGPGTAASPLCTISAATGRALAGDTILVDDGKYREQVRLPNSGEAGAPVTLRATGSGAVILGSDDVSDPTGWTSTSTSAWQRPFLAPSNPTQVWLDGTRLARATSATTTTPGSWFYDTGARLLYVDVGGGNPGIGHRVSAGARNFGILLRAVSHVEVAGLRILETNLVGAYLDAVDEVTLRDLHVEDSGSHGITVDASTGVQLTGIVSRKNLSMGVRFFNSTASALRQARTDHNQFHGVSVQGSERVLISGVTSFSNDRPGDRVATGIDVSSASVDTVVERSTTYGNDDSGIQAYSGAAGTVVRRNLSYDNGDHGIDNLRAPGSVVVANTVVGNDTAGINFEGDSHSAFVRDNVAVDNAVDSSRTVGEIRVDESSTPGTSLDRDLVFQSSGGPLLEWASQEYTSLASFQAASGQEPGGIAEDPRFVDLAGRDLRLTGSSPGIDAAYTAFDAWLSTDLAGNTPVDSPTVADSGNGPEPYADLGAYESSGPVASGSVAPTSGFVPFEVTVDGSASNGVGAPIVSHRWDCGNGSFVDGAVGTCTYTAPGDYAPTLLVTDADGLVDTWRGQVRALTEVAPTAALTASPGSGYTPQDVVLDASASTDMEDHSPIADYRFDCGNGTVSAWQTSPQTTCSYTTAQTYTASVDVRDTGGRVGSAQTTVEVLADVPPTAQLQLSSPKVSRGQILTADASGSTSIDKSPVATFRFSCGSGPATGEQTAPTTTCTYSSKGTYDVRVWVTDTVGLVGTASKRVKVG